MTALFAHAPAWVYDLATLSPALFLIAAAVTVYVLTQHIATCVAGKLRNRRNQRIAAS